ncbi:MAG TPA: amino acid ABC transporter permease [Planctomycetota bacterium]|jgi:polar amino acid transport system permease protein
MDFQQYVFGAPYFGWLCRGVAMTLFIAALTTVFSAALSLLVLRGRTSRSRLWRCAGIVYVNVFRNMPLVPLLLFLSFGLPSLWRNATGTTFPKGCEFCLLIVALSFNTSAYLSEILRAGVAAIPLGQEECARTLGLPIASVRWRVVYPQAFRIVAPAVVTRLIHNMKNSCLALVIPLPVDWMEVLGQAGRVAGQTFSWCEPLVFAAAVHLTLALVLSHYLNGWAVRQQLRCGVAA